MSIKNLHGITNLTVLNHGIVINNSEKHIHLLIILYFNKNMSYLYSTYFFFIKITHIYGVSKTMIYCFVYDLYSYLVTFECVS